MYKKFFVFHPRQMHVSWHVSAMFPEYFHLMFIVNYKPASFQCTNNASEGKYSFSL